jgi:molybdopterin-binding protein
VKISARNVLRGKVKAITSGDVNSEVVIEVAAGVDIVSIVSVSAIEELKLEVGHEAFAVFPASSTMVAVPHHKRGED